MHKRTVRNMLAAVIALFSLCTMSACADIIGGSGL